MESCTQCKDGKLVEEDVGTERAKICKNCGFMVEESTLQSSSFHGQEGYSLDNGSSLEKKYRVKLDSAGGHRISRARQIVLQQVKSYTSNLSGGEHIYAETEVLFNQFLDNSVYYNTHVKFKTSLAAACLVQVLRGNGHGVLVDEICRDFGIDDKNMSRLMYEVKAADQGRKNVLMSDIVDGIFQKQPDIRDRHSLKKVVLNLCQLFEDLYTSACHSRRLVAQCALYFALLSEERESRITLNMREFCKSYKVGYQSCCNLCKNMREKLLLMAKRLPWVKQPVQKSKIHCYITDILKSKHALLSRTAHDRDIPVISPINHKNSVDVSDCPTTKRCKVEHEQDVDGKPHITEQMVLEMPPSLIRNMNKQPEERTECQEPVYVSNSEILNEDEIKDSELGEYIRTEKEIALLSSINHMVK